MSDVSALLATADKPSRPAAELGGSCDYSRPSEYFRQTFMTKLEMWNTRIQKIQPVWSHRDAIITQRSSVCFNQWNLKHSRQEPQQRRVFVLFLSSRDFSWRRKQMNVQFVFTFVFLSWSEEEERLLSGSVWGRLIGWGGADNWIRWCPGVRSTKRQPLEGIRGAGTNIMTVTFTLSFLFTKRHPFFRWLHPKV